MGSENWEKLEPIQIGRFSPSGIASGLKFLAILLIGSGTLVLFSSCDSATSNPKLVSTKIGPADCLAFSPDGRFLATGSSFPSKDIKKYWKGVLQVWDFSQEKEVLSLEQSQWVRSVSFSPDNKFLAVGCGSFDEGRQGFLNFKEEPGEVIVYQLPKFEEVQKFVLDGRAVKVLFSPDSSMLVAALGEMDDLLSYVRLWKTDSFKELMTIRNLKSRIPSPVFTPDSKTLIIGAGRPGPGVINSYNLPAQAPTSQFPLDVEVVKMSTLSPDGKLLAVVADGGKVFFFNYPQGTPLDLPAFGKPTSGELAGGTVSVAFSDDGKFIAHTTNVGSVGPYAYSYINLFDLDKKATVFSWREKRVLFPSVGFSSTHKLFAIGGNSVKLLTVPK